jgi:4-hydroxy-tetrahydrodipicolinate reductase
MNYALVGSGRMGQAVETEAGRRGHRKVGEFDPGEVGGSTATVLEPALLGRPEVVFEFTEPSAAESNVLTLLEAGLPVVCGTTGWKPSPAVEAALAASGAGAIVAPNFSIGMMLFSRLAREAGRVLGAAGLHRPWVLEEHHTGKKDAPSGTARRLVELVMEVDPRMRVVQEGNPADRLPEEALQVVSLRSGSEAGTHTVGFDGEYDRITLTHRARSRAGFAIGAVMAAEWLIGRRGLHRFEDVVDSLLDRRPES